MIGANNGSAPGAIVLENGHDVRIEIDTHTGLYVACRRGVDRFGTGMVSVLDRGAWHRTLRSPDAVSGDLHVAAARREEGHDSAGAYEGARLTWDVPETGTRFETSIRLYHDSPVAIFAASHPDAAGDGSVPRVVFPQFLEPEPAGHPLSGPGGLHAWVPGFMGFYATAHGIRSAAEGFVDPDRPGLAVPLVLYDDAFETTVLSPYSDFLVASQHVERPGGGFGYGFGSRRLLSCGLHPRFAIPAGLRHETLLLWGSGINATMRRYGDLLLARAGKSRPDKYADETIRRLSYWVDYGSYYCGNWTDGGKHESYEEVMIALAQEAEEQGLVIGSWEVQDGDQNRWPEGLFEMREHLAPRGLRDLRERIGAPLYAYYSFLDPGPYRTRYPYRFTGRVAYGGIGSVGMGDVFYTEEYWDDQMAKVKAWGAEGLQHDFLSNYWNTPLGPDLMDRYMKSLGKAALKHGVSLQYCMCFSNNVLETTENHAVVSLQAIADHHCSTEDGGCGSNLRSLVFSCLLYGALGLWPARDNIQSRADADAHQDILVANLTGGPVQLGHRLGEADVPLLRRVFREGDGLLLKPDRPLTPIDPSFLAEDALIASTESRHVAELNGDRLAVVWRYVLSLNIGANGGAGGRFAPQDCAPVSTRSAETAVGNYRSERILLYDVENGNARIVAPTERVACPDGVKHSYYALCPVFPNGCALIGDAGKFVTMADARITGVSVDAQSLRFSVESGAGTAVLRGFSPTQPASVQIDGLDRPPSTAAAFGHPIGRPERDRSVEGRGAGASETHHFRWEPDTGLWSIAVQFAGGRDVRSKRIHIRW